MKQILDPAQFVFTPGAANAGTIRFLPDLVTGNVISLDQIQVITNVTRNVVIYDFGDPAIGEFAFNNATSTLTLAASTTGQLSTDTIQVIVDVPVDPYAPNPIWGRDPSGNPTTLSLTETGQTIVADGRVVRDTRIATAIGTVVKVDTTGYGSVVLQLTGTFTGTITFQASNDETSWSTCLAWATAGAAAPVTTATAVGQWVIPAAGRFIRAQITTAGTGSVVAVATLKQFGGWVPTSSPSIAANSSVNVAQIGGTAVVTGGVAGIQAIGGNIAVGAAPTANPVPVGGWDGTNTRRILTDAVSGGVALGAAGVSNGASVSTLISAATNNLTQLKGTLGRVHVIDIFNTVASVRYLKLFNLPSASVTMGTTNATLNLPIAANGRLSIVTDLGINLGGTGISYALTGAAALNDNTAIGAGDLIANFQFV